MNFDIHVLGSNSALPTIHRNPSCHVVNFREKLFMIDCGEGAQVQMRKQRLKFSRLNNIFISHLHGDHIFGLPGLLSTFGLLNRTADLHIYSPVELQSVLMAFLSYFSHKLPYKLIFHVVSATHHELIYNDRSLEVWTVPLSHRVPTCGYLFKEKPSERNIKKDMVSFYNLSIKEMKAIKEGKDHVMADGTIVLNKHLTIDPKPIRSYAYCSDTQYLPDNARILKKVSLLYHEATFASEDELLASGTYHSTSGQAAQLAQEAEAEKLLIGHFSARYKSVEPLLDSARRFFKNTIAAEDGMVIRL